jgi:CheY-like chemotaxis protein
MSRRRRLLHKTLEAEFPHGRSGSGHQALDLRRDKPDLIILDLGLPISTGWRSSRPCG